MINDIALTQSENVGFDDAFDAGIGVSGGVAYPLSETLSVVGGASLQSFGGNAVSLGSVDGEAMTGTLSDMQRLNVDAGLQYSLPAQTVGQGLALRPYIEGRAGVAHTSGIALDNAQMSGRPVNGGEVGLYKDSWSPTASAIIGAEIPVNDNVDVAVEGQIRRTGALKSDDSYFGPGDPLAGTNNAKHTTDLSVGVKLRSTF